ncbi:MAG TPA: PQQ-dependent sugar dehydrogenase [Acidimicrobiia bacterium]|jgi:glucose/arabinose dehydrogenase
MTRWFPGAAIVLVVSMAAASCSETTPDAAGSSTTGEPPNGTTSESSEPPATTGGGPGASSTTVATSTTTALPELPLRGLDLELIGEGFHQPTVVASPPGDLRLFVVERQGTIEIIDPEGGPLEGHFLDLRDRVGSNGIEQGLLGLAFHPDYEANGRLFVYYVTTVGNRRLAEYRVGDDPNQADVSTERVLLEREQPPDSSDIRHYAGNVLFGPDGYLYVSLGDGADFRNQGQDPNTVFASIIRIDVDGGEPYAIPADNPFVDGGGAPEVWAYGLRNPWRFTIDPVERLLYVADVGQADYEEVNIVSIDEGGYNFGWPITEGKHCFSPADCDMAGLTLPVIEYDHESGCSVTGGHVYRGAAIAELDGHYFYADWCNGWVRSLNYTAGPATTLRDWTADLAGVGQPNTFGIGGDGELYVANYEGQVFRIVPVR